MLNHVGTQLIKTTRLTLRQYKMTDADDMFRNWVADPEVSKFWGWEPHKNIGVISYHHVDNPASGRVQQKSGMRYTQTVYKQATVSGDYCYYEVTRADWKRMV